MAAPKTRAEAAHAAWCKVMQLTPCWREACSETVQAWEAAAQAAVDFVPRKTPGQVAYEAGHSGNWALQPPAAKGHWESIAQSVLDNCKE